MKNKKFTYILIVLVAFIWGIFFFMLFSNSSSDEYKIEIEPYTSVTEKGDITFKNLELDYSDPFLSRNIVSSFSNDEKKTSETQPKLDSPKPSPTLNQKIIWPKIEYGGTVNISKALIKINNRLHITEKGDTTSGVVIKKIFTDSIHLNYQKEHKTVFKNN